MIIHDIEVTFIENHTPEDETETQTVGVKWLGSYTVKIRVPEGKVFTIEKEVINLVYFLLSVHAAG